VRLTSDAQAQIKAKVQPLLSSASTAIGIPETRTAFYAVGVKPHVVDVAG
jgi:hypothetical protein